jgi:hypothetical protein
VGRLKSAPALVGAAGFALLMLGTAMVVSVSAQTSASALAVSGPYELYCPGTPVGNVVLNDATTSGVLSPAAPTSGQQFSLTGYQTSVSIPASLASAAAAIQPNLQGSATAQIDAVGATPTTTSVGPLNFNVPIPSPVPAGGVGLSLPSTPQSVGPFTATGSDIAIQEDSSASISLTVAGNSLALTCTAYPNNSVTPSGITTSTPTASPIAPVIATAGSPTTATTGATTTTNAGSTTTQPPSQLTGAYELYCPGTPVGSVVLNDAVTSATLSPASPSAGQSFSLTGYQITVNIPNSLASAAAAVSPGQPLAGTATTQIDASGATPATTPEGPLSFSVAIPTPIPAAGVSLSVPSTPATVSGFTATSGGITIQEDSAATISLTVAGNSLALTCTAYPNNSVTPSGITTTTPTAAPIAPVIALASGGSTATTTTAVPGVTTTTDTTPVTQQPGGTAAYELFCPGTPVGNIALNGVVTTGTITPAAPATGQQFNLTNYSTTLVLPSSIASAAAALGNSAIAGSAVTKVDATGATPPTISSGGLTFNAPLPSPVPATGITLNVPSTPIAMGPFTASGGVITLSVDSSVQLTLVVSGSNLNLTCKSYPNNSVATGIVARAPQGAPVSPVIATTSTESTTTTSTSTTSTSTSTSTSTPPTTTSTIAPTTTTTPSGSSTTHPPGNGTTTQPPSTSGSGGTSPTATRVATAASSSLAFTGSGPGLKTVTLLGAALMLLGLLMLLLADIPRRVLRQLGYLGQGDWRVRAGTGTRTVARTAREEALRRTMWVLGR